MIPIVAIMKTTEKVWKEVNVRQALFRDSRCLALAANAVTTCKHNSLGARKHNNTRHRKHTRANTRQPGRLKRAIKTLDGFKRTSENR